MFKDFENNLREMGDLSDVVRVSDLDDVAVNKKMKTEHWDIMWQGIWVLGS